MKSFMLVVLALIGCSAIGQSMSMDGEYFEEVHRFHEKTTDDEDTDVYWRTWRGKIPKDAIFGGYTESDCGTDVPVYMGLALQTTTNAAIVPVQIMRRSKSVKIPFAGKVTTTKKGVQVMCARDRFIVTWVSKNDTLKYNMSVDKDCVIGGTELQKFNTFFGKTKHDDNTVIGKVLHHEKKMYFANDGEEIMVHDYEILCFSKAVDFRIAEWLKAMRSDKKENIQQTSTTEPTTTVRPRPMVRPRFG